MGGTTKWVDADMEDSDPLPLFVLQGDLPQPPIVISKVPQSISN